MKHFFLTINFIFIILLSSCQANNVLSTPSFPPNTSVIPLPTATLYPYSNTSNELTICQYKKIAFIGGSITGGSGASQKSMSYASKVGEWFLSNCSEQISINNISIGGTGSDFAAYRLEHDLGRFIPDLAFVEFAVNDGRFKPDYIKEHIEGLVYKLRRINPDMLIFSVLTTRISHQEFYENGILPREVDIHLQTASELNIPVINVGQDLWTYVFKNGKDIQEYLRDNVHPNDLGHQNYSESIIQFLESYFNLPSGPYYGDLANASLADMSNVASTNCEILEKRWETYLHCEIGDWFTTYFKGDVLGFVGRIQINGGQLECIVDSSVRATMDFGVSSSKEKSAFWDSSDFWDSSATKNAEFWDSSDFWAGSLEKNLIVKENSDITSDRTTYFIPFTDLEEITHNLTCIVLDTAISDNVGKSKRNIVEVYYFMINP